jgi:hypothetical protein
MNNLFLTEFYVYWVNGGVSPYFVVILRQTGTMVAGNSLAANQNSRGWFQDSFQLLPNSVRDTSNQPITQGLQLAAYSPVTGGGSIPVQLSVPMTLIAKSGGGVGPVAFNAQVQDILSYPGWGLLDQSSGSGTAWLSYQTQTWNPVQNPFSEFGDWWGSVYDQNDHVIQMPDLSSGSIYFEAVTAWQFGPPLFVPPAKSPFTPAPALPVHFFGGWLQNIAFLHNPTGCRTGDPYPGHHHLFGEAVEWDWAFYIDLGVVANWGNLTAVIKRAA